MNSPAPTPIGAQRYLQLRAACSALDVIEASRVKVANTLGLDADGNAIPSRTAHVFAPVALMIPNADEMRRQRINMTPLLGLQLAEKAARKSAVEALYAVATPRLLEWAKSEPGVGDITLARLLGEIGHPRRYQPMEWQANPDFDDSKPSSVDNPKRLLVPTGPERDRTIDQLWQYSRVGDYTTHPRHFQRLGVEVTQAALFRSGKPRVRSRLHVMADTIVRQSFRVRDDERIPVAIAEVRRRNAERQGNPPPDDGTPHVDPYAHLPLAAVYLVRKAVKEGNVHAHECKPCRAEEGDPWRPAHHDQDARRFVAKHALKRIWLLS